MMKHRSMLGMMLILLLMSVQFGPALPLVRPVVVAAAARSDDASFERLAHVGGSAEEGYAIAAGGTTAYIAQASRIAVIDASDPAASRLRGTVEGIDGPDVVEMEVEGATLYIAHRQHGLTIIDVANPAAPSLVGRYDSGAGVTDLAVSGGRAYLGLGTAIRIVDVSDPSQPTLLRDFASCSSDQLAAAGPYLYGMSGCGLQIINISVPQNPQVVGTYAAGGSTLAVSNGLVYTSVNYRGYRDWAMHVFRVIDVSQPSQPTLRYEANSGGWPAGMWADGPILAYGSNEIYAVSNPAAPAKLGNLAIQSFRDTALTNGVAYVLESGGLTIFSVRATSAPVRRGHYTVLNTVSGVRVEGAHAYTYGPFGMQVLDIANPRQPRILGEYVSRDVADIEVSAGWVYAADTKGFVSLDVSNPLSPTIRSANPYRPIVDIELSGATAYIGEERCLPAVYPPGSCSQIVSLVNRVDLSNPAAPVVIDPNEYHYYPAESGSNAYMRDLALADGVIYAALGMNVDVYRQADGSSQRYPGSVADLEAAGGRLYAVGAGGLSIYAAGSPPALTLLSTLPLSSSADIEISGTLAYVAGAGGVQVVSLADPAQPHVLATYATGAPARDVEVAGDLVLVAEGGGGLEILRYYGPTETVGALTPAGGSLTSPDGALAFSFPAGAVAEPVTLSLLQYGRPPHPLSLRERAAQTFRLTAAGPDGELAALDQPYALTITYTPGQLAAQGIPAASLELAAWADGAWRTVPLCGGCTLNQQTHQLTSSSPTLGIFVLRGLPFQAMMPLVQR